MKYIYWILLCVLPLCANSEGFHYQREGDSIQISKLLNDLNASWTLGVIDERSPVDIALFNQFKDLFTEDATIDDEFNAEFRYDPKATNKYVYKLTRNKNVADYAHDIALQVTRIKDSNSIMQMDSKALDPLYSKGSDYVYRIFKMDSVWKRRPYVLESNATYFGREIDTLRKKKLDSLTTKQRDIIYQNALYNHPDSMYLFVSHNFLLITLQRMDGNEFKIRSIVREAKTDDTTTFICANDKDNDGILDSEERSVRGLNTFGDFTGRGLRDFDFDGVPDNHMKRDKCDKCKYIYGLDWNHGCPASYFVTRIEFSAFTNIRRNTVDLFMPLKDQVGYDQMDLNLSKDGLIESDTAQHATFNISIGGETSVFFGKHKKIGLGIGLTFSQFELNYILTEPAQYTYKANDGVNDYRRRITLNQCSEQIKYTIFNMPLMLKYRRRFVHYNEERNSYIEISAGPSLLYFHNRSNHQGSVSFEGLYQIDSTTNQFTYSNYFDEQSNWNLYLTGDKINHQSNNPGVDSLFNQLNAAGNYDFGMNKSFGGTDRKANRIGVALNARVDYCYQVKKIVLKFGMSLTYAKSLDQSLNYKPLKQIADLQDNNSLFRTTTFTHTSYGINIGLAYGF